MANRIFCGLVALFLAATASAAPTIEIFQQKLDPKSVVDSRTFGQRFFIDSTFAEGPNSPVLYFMCGEGNCFDTDQGGPIPVLMQYEAAHFKAHIVALEHRYFGLSQPFAELTRQNLRYLTFENALSDLAAFETYAIENRQLHGKWIAAGGSYPGVLAAYYRLKYPSMVVGALASSAPVRAKYVNTAFDSYASDRLTPACAANLQAVLAHVREGDGDPATLLADEKSLGLPDSFTTSKSASDFADLLSGFTSPFVQFGLTDRFCALLAEPQPMAKFTGLGAAMLKALGISIESLINGPVATDVTQYESGVGDRQWMYMQCTEFGYFGAETDASLCTDVFGTIPFDKLWRVNRDYYQPLLDPRTTNIVFTSGSSDPWTTLTINALNGNAVNPNTSSYVIQGAAHCADFNAQPDPKNSDSLNGAIQLITNSFAQWLK